MVSLLYICKIYNYICILFCSIADLIGFIYPFNEDIFVIEVIDREMSYIVYNSWNMVIISVSINDRFIDLIYRWFDVQVWVNSAIKPLNKDSTQWNLN